MNGALTSRRRFLLGSGAWLGASALGLGASAGRARTVSIFHTTDLHGHILPTQTYEGLSDVGGLARCASCIRQWRRESPHSLLVDLGDVYQGTPASYLSEGRRMIELFNRLGYDSWTLGNHDFDWGPEALERNLSLAQAPVLTGNLERSGRAPGSFAGTPWEKVRPWMMKEVGGFRIALIGLVTPGLPYWLTPETLAGVLPTDPVESLGKSVAEAKAEHADAIVVLGHMGWRPRDDFANPVFTMLKEVKGIDLYLGGHTHQNQPHWEWNGVLCSQASYYGIHCGRVDLTFDQETRKLVGKQAHTLLMDDRYALDPLVLELAGPDLKTATEQLARKLGTVPRPIPGSGRGSRLATLFCELFAAALKRNQTPVDGVFHGTFGTGELPAGDITVGDCWTLLPFENFLVTAEVSSEELLEIAREDAANQGSDRTLWPFELDWDAEGKPARFHFRGEPVPAGKRFTIGFNSYDSQSGGQRLMRLREIVAQPSAKRRMTPIETRAALMDGILERKELT